MTHTQPQWEGAVLSSGRYVVRSLLGRGGMGCVYLAWDRNLDTDVVVKFPHPELLTQANDLQRFLQEVQHLVRLVHPRIVRLYEVGKQEGYPYAVMQYLSGGSLADRMLTDARGRPIGGPVSHLFGWLDAIAEALDFLHERGYVHRDVKPANILFDASGLAYLTDLGLAKVCMPSSMPVSPGLTVVGTVLGTLEYMAPEMLLGRTVDRGGDQFALAAMVYEFLAGRVPYPSNTLAELAVAQTRPPTPLRQLRPDLPSALCQAVHRGLSLQPAARFATCAALAQSVQESLRSADPSAVRTAVARETESKVFAACPLCHCEMEIPPEAARRAIRCVACRQELSVSSDLRRLMPISIPASHHQARLSPPRPIQTPKPPIPTEESGPHRPLPRPPDHLPEELTIARQLRTASWMLIGLGLLIAVCCGLLFAKSLSEGIQQPPNAKQRLDHSWPALAKSLLYGLGLVASVYAVLGGLRLSRREAYWFSLTAPLLSLLSPWPLFGGLMSLGLSGWEAFFVAVLLTAVPMILCLRPLRWLTVPASRDHFCERRFEGPALVLLTTGLCELLVACGLLYAGFLGRSEHWHLLPGTCGLLGAVAASWIVMGSLHARREESHREALLASILGLPWSFWPFRVLNQPGIERCFRNPAQSRAVTVALTIGLAATVMASVLVYATPTPLRFAGLVPSTAILMIAVAQYRRRQPSV